LACSHDENLVVVSWPSVFRHCQALVSKGFRCFCPTVFVSVVGGEKIKTPKGGKKKIEFTHGMFIVYGVREYFAFVLRWGRHTLCKVLDYVLACATWQCV
jgi:hypothetical protein